LGVYCFPFVYQSVPGENIVCPHIPREVYSINLFIIVKAVTAGIGTCISSYRFTYMDNIGIVGIKLTGGFSYCDLWFNG